MTSALRDESSAKADQAGEQGLDGAAEQALRREAAHRDDAAHLTGRDRVDEQGIQRQVQEGHQKCACQQRTGQVPLRIADLPPTYPDEFQPL